MKQLTDSENAKLVSAILSKDVFPKIQGLAAKDFIVLTSNIALHLIIAGAGAIYTKRDQQAVDNYVNQILDSILGIRDQVKAGTFNEFFSTKEE